MPQPASQRSRGGSENTAMRSDPFQQFVIPHLARGDCQAHSCDFLIGAFQRDTVDLHKRQHHIHSDAFISVHKRMVGDKRVPSRAPFSTFVGYRSCPPKVAYTLSSADSRSPSSRTPMPPPVSCSTICAAGAPSLWKNVSFCQLQKSGLILLENARRHKVDLLIIRHFD